MRTDEIIHNYYIRLLDTLQDNQRHTTCVRCWIRALYDSPFLAGTGSLRIVTIPR